VKERCGGQRLSVVPSAGSASLPAILGSQPVTMMHSTQRYELNIRVDRELRRRRGNAHHLERGSYYSLLGPAAQVWSAIAAGRSAQEILGRRGSNAAAGSLDVSLEGFLNALMAEQ